MYTALLLYHFREGFAYASHKRQSSHARHVQQLYISLNMSTNFRICASTRLLAFTHIGGYGILPTDEFLIGTLLKLRP